MTPTVFSFMYSEIFDQWYKKIKLKSYNSISWKKYHQFLMSDYWHTLMLRWHINDFRNTASARYVLQSTSSLKMVMAHGKRFQSTPISWVGNVSNFNKVKCTKTLQEGNIICGFSKLSCHFQKQFGKGCSRTVQYSSH